MQNKCTASQSLSWYHTVSVVRENKHSVIQRFDGVYYICTYDNYVLKKKLPEERCVIWKSAIPRLQKEVPCVTSITALQASQYLPSSVFPSRALGRIKQYKILFFSQWHQCRSQWPRGLGRRSAAARLLKLWVRIPPGHWCFPVVSVVFCQSSLRRADHSSRGVLTTVVRRCVWSRNFLNDEVLAHWGVSLQKQTNKWHQWSSIRTVLLTDSLDDKGKKEHLVKLWRRVVHETSFRNLKVAGFT